MKNFKNVYSYDIFKETYQKNINEAIDISNETGWRNSLLGRGINKLFSLFRKGVAMGMAAKTIIDMKSLLNQVLVETIGEININEATSYDAIIKDLPTIKEISQPNNYTTLIVSYKKQDYPKLYLKQIYEEYSILKEKVDNNKLSPDEKQKKELEEIVKQLKNKCIEENIFDDKDDEDDEEKDITTKKEKEMIDVIVEQLKFFIGDLKDKNSEEVFKDKNFLNRLFSLIQLYKFAKYFKLYLILIKEIDEKNDNINYNIEKIEKNISTLNPLLDDSEKIFNKYENIKSKKEKIQDKDVIIYYYESDKKDLIDYYKEIRLQHKKAIDLILNKIEKINENNKNILNEGIIGNRIKTRRSKIAKEKAKNVAKDILTKYKELFEKKEQYRNLAQKNIERRKHKFTYLYIRFLRWAGLDIPQDVRLKETPNLKINEKDAQQANSYFEKLLFKMFNEYNDYFIDIEKINPKKLIKDSEALSGVKTQQDKEGHKNIANETKSILTNIEKNVVNQKMISSNIIKDMSSKGLTQDQYGIFSTDTDYQLVVKKVLNDEKNTRHIYKIIDIINETELNDLKTDNKEENLQIIKNASLFNSDEPYIFEKFKKLFLSNGGKLINDIRKNKESNYHLYTTKNIKASGLDKEKINTSYFNYLDKDNILCFDEEGKINYKERKAIKKEVIPRKVKVSDFIKKDWSKTNKQLRIGIKIINVFYIDDPDTLNLNDVKGEKFDNYMKNVIDDFYQKGFKG